MTKPLKTFIRYAALSASALAVSGAVAFSQGDSEFESLNSDPLEAMFGNDEDVDTGEISLGSRNNAVIIQKGNGGNTLELNQTGDRNLMVSSQTSLEGVNRAEIVQSGNDNMAFLRQDGTGNEYELLQSGDSNVSAAQQYGNNNLFQHTQNGNNLGFAVTQYGNSTVIVTQTGQ